MTMLARWIVLCVALLAAAGAQAQTGTAKSTAALNSEIGSLFGDNAIGQITPFNARQTLLDLVASSANLSSPNTWASRQIFAYTPAFDLAGGLLGVNVLFTTTGITVPAGANYQDIRASQPGGASNTATVGAGGVYSSYYATVECLAGSSASGNCYGAVLHSICDGPSTCRGAHLEGIGVTGATGPVSAAGAQINPVATNSGAWGIFASLTTSGVNNLAVAFGCESTGDQYAVCVGNSVNPTPIGSAYYRAWMASSSATTARAFQLLNPAGIETFFIHKDGSQKLLNASSVTLAEITATGGAGFGYPAGNFGAAENVTIKGFLGIGTSGGIVGVFGDTGDVGLVFGSKSNHLVQLRTNNTIIGALYPSGGFSLAASPTDPGAQNFGAAGNYIVTTAAKTLVLKQGANGAVGTFVCTSGGSITVSNTNVAITDTVIISLNTAGGTISTPPALNAITAATSFVAKCATSDTATYNYALIKNAA